MNVKWFHHPKALIECDLRALAAFRIGLGFILTLDIVMRAMDLTAFYTDRGVLPRGPYLDQFANSYHWSLYFINGYQAWVGLLMFVALAAHLCLLFGYRTRIATIVSWILLISIHNRNPLVLNGGDVLLRMLVFWAMFLPLGRLWSFDRALAKEEPNDPKSWISGATLGICLMPVLIYGCTFLLKTGKEWFPEGTASYYALQLDQFVTHFGAWMGQHHEMLRWGTYFVWFLEGAAPFLLLCPFFLTPVRLVTLALLAGMHLNFDISMRIGLFPWIDMLALIPLLPIAFWDWIEERLRKPDKLAVKLYYDGDCGFCKRMILVVRTFFLYHDTEVATGQSDPEIWKTMDENYSWVVVDAAGQQHIRFAGAIVVAESSPWFGMIARFLPLRALSGLGDKAYNFVAYRRDTFGQISAKIFPYVAMKPLVHNFPLNLVTVVFAGYVVLWNLQTLKQINVKIKYPFNRVGSVLRLDQKWNMFAPYPLKNDGWFVYTGTLKDGTEVDVLNETEGAPSFDKPDFVADQNPNARWRKYRLNIWQKKYKGHRLYHGKYICRDWNNDAEGDKRLHKWQMHFMRERTPPPGGVEEVKKFTIWRHDCLK